MKQIIYLLFPTLLFFCQSCAFVSVPLFQPTSPLEEKTVQGTGKEKIVMVDISGIISSEKKRTLSGFSEQPDMVARIKEELDKAAEDKNVRGLILRINSPGGTTTASDIIHREILRFKKKTNAPVVACLLDLATSGAYYIASAADRIIAHPTTVTGSIGVIAMKFDVSGLMGKLGISEESIKSGEKKDIMSPFRGLTDEERGIMQDIVDSLHKQFVTVVEQGRPQLTASDITSLADGRVFTAAQAKEHKLIDDIGYLDEAIEKVKEKTGLAKVRIVMYVRPPAYKNNIYSHSSVNIFGLADTAFTEQFPVRFLYLWNP